MKDYQRTMKEESSGGREEYCRTGEEMEKGSCSSCRSCSGMHGEGEEDEEEKKGAEWWTAGPAVRCCLVQDLEESPCPRAQYKWLRSEEGGGDLRGFRQRGESIK